MISEKNFSNADPTALPADTEYERCNFSHTQPASLGPALGVRLWPGDDTPRTFTDCNLFNCEPPPGSTLVNSNAWIAETGLNAHVDELTVNGVVQHTNQYHKGRRHGRYNPVTEQYDYETPVEYGEDFE